MPSTSAPYVLLLVVKSGHVGSEWLAQLVHKQRFGAFKHEANACVRSQQLVSGLVTGAGCSKIPIRDNSSLPLMGLSFNVGAFGENAIETWKAALHATPPTVPIMVVSLTRTNTIKWAWSVYRHQVFEQTSHVRSNDSTSVRRPFEPVRAEPTCMPSCHPYLLRVVPIPNPIPSYNPNPIPGSDPSSDPKVRAEPACIVQSACSP